VTLLAAAPAAAQSAMNTRLAILLALERGATSANDLRTLRTGTRSGNSDIARLAYRSLGRLSRPALVSDILPGLRHALPEVRADAADALAQALADGPATGTSRAAALTTVQDALTARLAVEADGMVRGVLRESLARLPYTRAADVAAAVRTIREATRAEAQDRLGTARGLEAIIRNHGTLLPPDADTLDTLKTLAAGPLAGDARDARVRRASVDALILARAVDDPLVGRLMADADAQVRQRAMRAVAAGNLDAASLRGGLADSAPGVRLEALRGLAGSHSSGLCPAALGVAYDPDLTTALGAVDLLAQCGELPEAILYLETAMADRADLNVPRAWQRSAHALVALAMAAPDRIGNRLDDYARASLWPVRRYAVRAAAVLNRRETLDRLAIDAENEVASAARIALGFPGLPEAAPKPVTLRVSANDLRRLAAPRARITVREVGRFEIALLAEEAPFTVLRFVELAEAGYYNGTAFDAPTANATAQAGDRADGQAAYPRAEAGRWPHVRGTVALADRESRGARFFINLADTPAFDHEYTIFGQVLNGSDVVDRILEGDIIEDIEIVP
jgi:peptidyl-prolyl cis-trans isomerase B (cyclophilin B)